mgnify:CR=1 FL=1|jgi:transcriptional regulator with XRE-family HTH domain
MVIPRRYDVALLQKGMTQKEIAGKMGVYQSHLNAWLNGKRVPSYNNLVKMSLVLDEPLESLLEKLKYISSVSEQSILQ